jgi:hypothetical protein
MAGWLIFEMSGRCPGGCNAVGIGGWRWFGGAEAAWAKVGCGRESVVGWLVCEMSGRVLRGGNPVGIGGGGGSGGGWECGRGKGGGGAGVEAG